MPWKVNYMAKSKKVSKSKNTLTKPSAQNSKKDLILFDIASLKQIDEIIIGDPNNDPGVWIRLMESDSGKRYIHSYSSLSKQWNMVSRYNVEENWQRWKETHARIYNKRYQNQKRV